MHNKQTNFFLTLVSAFLLVVALSGCDEEQAETIKEEAGSTMKEVVEKIQLAGYNFQSDLTSKACEEIKSMSIEGGEGSGVPGVAGAARWGMPEGTASSVRVRRSWSTLNDAETAVDYGNPEYPDDWRGAMFNFSEIRADEMFDFRALGFQYDTNQPQ